MNKYTEMKLIRLQNNQFDILLYNSQKKREWGRGGDGEGLHLIWKDSGNGHKTTNRD